MLRSTSLFAGLVFIFSMMITLTSATLVIVKPSDPTFAQDVQEFNFAPTLLSQSNNNTIINTTMIKSIYFAHSEQEVELALLEILYSGSSTSNKKIQVRSGRHSYVAVAQTTPEASVLDISNLTLDASAEVFDSICAGESCQLLRVPAGVRLFSLYAFLAARNLYFPGGSCPSVGVSGFVLGGGIGLYSRQRGLGAQNLFGARVAQVTSDRTVAWKNASEAENSDLLWALRGGGNNNFGVVTELTLRVFPAPTTVSMLRVQINDAATCVIATQVYQEFLVSSSSGGNNNNNTNALCDITATFYYYHTNCAIVTLSTILSFDELSQKTQEIFVKNIPGSQITQTMQDEASWINALATISGCSSVADCAERAARSPDLNGPSYWTAMSVLSNKSLSVSEIHAIVEAIQAPLIGINISHNMNMFSHNNPFNKPMMVPLIKSKIPSSSSSSSSIKKSQNSQEQQKCSFFPVLIVDGLGCKVSEYGKTIPTSFPWSKSTDSNNSGSPAMFHVQILAYNTFSQEAANSSSSQELEECQKEVDKYVFDIFSQFDHALPKYQASYRNYPNERLPNALRRYYGSEENLGKLKSLVQVADPLKMFSNYSQGIN